MTQALLVIDVQNDFCSGGALAVPEGEHVVPAINEMMDRFEAIVLTQDWHPADHASFVSRHPGAAPFSVTEMPYGDQVLWPDHCVQGSRGAEFHPDLRTDRAQSIVRKGFRAAIDSYSAFFENDHETPTGLAGYLRDRNVTGVTLAGLATDFCVAWSAMDAVKLGFGATVILDACRAIDLDGSLEDALEALSETGVILE